MVTTEGILIVTMKGMNFVSPIDGSADIHVRGRYAKGAMHGDKVVVRIVKESVRDRAAEGEIVEILERGTNTLVGTLEKSNSLAFVTSDDPRVKHEIFVSPKHIAGAKTGDKVVVEITKWAKDKKDYIRGKVVEVLGRYDAPGVDILSVMRTYNLYDEFPEKVMREIDEIPDEVLSDEASNRRDLREFPIVTIDGEDAKDLDDGVYAEELEEGFRLLVAIADVSHYVGVNTALNHEALKRGTSVYLADRVVPMLPKKLSNGICSLNANEDRLAMAADMIINFHGEVVKSEFYPAVICVKRRLSYRIVNKILVDKDKVLTKDNKDILPMLKILKKLRNVLLKKRQKAGAIEFETTEVKIKLDAEGKPVKLEKRTGSLGESVIEECMLIANEEAAKLFEKKKVPGIYRVHPQPKEDDIDALNEKISPLGYFIKKRRGGRILPKDVQSVIKKSKGKPEETIINFTTLRAMQQAYYSEKNDGHFGLSKEFYTHFTSPIRRYPDLIVHRIIKEILLNETPKDKNKRLILLKEIAKQTSGRERNAIEAERAVSDLKKAEYMGNFLGEEFEGIITSVTNFGMFVELDNGVEGLVHVSNMTRDRYVYDERSFSLIGERTGEEYRLGEKLTVAVLKVDLKERSIDFCLPEDMLILSEAERKEKKKAAKLKKKQESKEYKKSKHKHRRKSKHKKNYNFW